MAGVTDKAGNGPLTEVGGGPSTELFTGRRFAAITASDTVDLAYKPRALFVGGAGNVALVGLDGTVVTFNGLQDGQVLEVAYKRVNSTNTTASNLVAIY